MNRRIGVLTLALLAACAHTNQAHKDAIEKARLAHLRGDLDEEALALRAACIADKSDKDACDGAAQVAEAAIVHDVAVARAACDHADVPSCLAALRGARKLSPTDTRIANVLQWAGGVHANLCTHGRKATPDDSITILRCLESEPDLAEAPGYAKRVGIEARTAGHVFSTMADAMKGDLSGSFAAWSAASCFDPAHRASTDAARLALIQAHAVPLLVSVGHLGSSDARPAELMCGTLATQLGPRVRCSAATPDAPPPLELAIRLALGQIEHRVSEEPTSVHYQAGTRVTDNPDHDTAERAFFHAQHAFREIEELLSQQQAGCDAAESALSRANSCYDCGERTQRDTACNERDQTKNLYDSRQSEMNQAQNTLSSTPATLEEAIYRDFAYTIRNHVWRSQYQASLRRGNEPQLMELGEITYEDSEHEGFDPAGLGADPLTPPDPSFFSAELTKRMTARANDLAAADLAARANTRRAQCADPAPRWEAPWLGCWAESSLWAGQPLDAVRLFEASATLTPGLPAPRCLGR